MSQFRSMYLRTNLYVFRFGFFVFVFFSLSCHMLEIMKNVSGSGICDKNFKRKKKLRLSRNKNSSFLEEHSHSFRVLYNLCRWTSKYMIFIFYF